MTGQGTPDVATSYWTVLALKGTNGTGSVTSNSSLITVTPDGNGNVSIGLEAGVNPSQIPVRDANGDIELGLAGNMIYTNSVIGTNGQNSILSWTEYNLVGVGYKNIIGLGNYNSQLKVFSSTAIIVDVNGTAFTLDDVQDGIVKRDSNKLFTVGSVSALPTANATQRGKIAMVQGASGVADSVYACKKLANDTYSWVQVA
jgi:hypothetical protein